jgi:tRNA(fMet)-specific endonuclease VapC
MSRQILVLDSDTLSEVLKAIDPVVASNANAYLQELRSLTFTSASVLEILHGLQSKLAHAKIQRFEAVFAKNNEIAPDEQDYRLGAEISGALQRQGTPIGLIDPLIEACPIRRGYGVASRNTDHFKYMHRAGYAFHLENWRDT